jgi:hypothetical protein
MRHANENHGIRIMLAALFTGLPALAQSITININDPRPVSVLAQKIEELSGKPINYEDVRYDNSADIKDIADSIMTPAQRSQAAVGLHVLVPVGGSMSVTITVDPATQRLIDTLSVTNALSTLVAAANSSPNLPGRYRVESYNDGFYIVPTQQRSVTGAFISATPVLSVPITLNGGEATAWEALKAILLQVSQAAGIKVDIGTVPIKLFATSKVALSASSEPAYRVLSRLFAPISNGVSALPSGGAPTLSYSLLFDPKMRFYALNVHVVQGPSKTQDPPPAPTLLPVPNPSKFYNIGSKKGL